MVRRFSLVLAAALTLVVGGRAIAQGAPHGNGGKKQGKPAPTKPADPPAKPPPAPAPAAEKPTVPFFGNSLCPVDGKPASRELFAEVDGQRIYVDAEACKDAVKKDGAAMLAKAYPNTATVTTKACPACAKPVDAAKGKEVVFQGRKLMLCGDACATTFKQNPWLAIVKATWPDAKDAANATDPIDGKPVDPALLAIYKKHIVHFSSPKSLAAFEKDPETTIAKLKLSVP